MAVSEDFTKVSEHEGDGMYIPARLREFPSGWVIEWWILDLTSMQMVRHRKKVQRSRTKFPTDKQARTWIEKLCRDINKKLELGFDPSDNTQYNRRYTLLINALNQFIAFKEKELRHDGIRTYKSQVSMLTKWIKSKGFDDICCGSFSVDLADMYLNDVLQKKQMGATTWNNYLLFMRTIWNWMKAKGYVNDNPFERIRKLKHEIKRRETIPPDWDKRVLQYCRSYDPGLELVCSLVYSAFLRPAEICRIQLRDLDFEKYAILVRGENAKNGRERWAVMTEPVSEQMKAHISGCSNPSWHVFSRMLEPGPWKIETRRIDKHWTKMRDRIEMPMCYQLYSYRDTSITDLKNSGMADYMITNLTGHRTIGMLLKYTHAPKPEAVRAATENIKSLGSRS